MWERTFQTPIYAEIRRRKWNWTGHILTPDDDSIAKAALDLNPQGSIKQGRPAQTWRRSVNEEEKVTELAWKELKALFGHSPNQGLQEFYIVYMQPDCLSSLFDYHFLWNQSCSVHPYFLSMISELGFAASVRQLIGLRFTS